MNSQEWLKVKKWLHEVEALPLEQRQPWLSKREPEDPSVCAQVIALLEEEAPSTQHLQDSFKAPSSQDSPTVQMKDRELGSWRMVRELGRGGMGSVWLAERTDPRLKMTAAIKILDGEAVSPELIDRFYRERQLLADLHHPHICMLHDGGMTPDDLPYFVMEYIDGQHIDIWCETNGCTLVEKLSLVKQVASAVAYAHNKGVLHRDIKPANIMVTAHGFPKLMDFGIARQSMAEDPRLTRPNQLLLTPEYAAPEQLRGSAVGLPCDIYALGLVLFRLLTGKRPLEVAGSYLSHLPTQLPAELVTLLAQMLESDPTVRPTAKTVQDTLEPLIQSSMMLTFRQDLPRIYLCHRPGSDRHLAKALVDAFREKKHFVFWPQELGSGLPWSTYEKALSESDYVIVLLSKEAAVSEMVYETLNRVRTLHEKGERPTILPIRINFPINAPLDYRSRDFLGHLQHGTWENDTDTPKVIHQISNLLENSGEVAPEWERPQDVTAITQQDFSESDLPGGTISLNSPFYMEPDPALSQCFDEIRRPGSLIRIKAPRQMGKTSLMMRILAHATEQNLPGVRLSLQMADGKILGDLDRFLRWFCAVIGRRLKHPASAVNDLWDDIFGAKDNCTAYFEEVLLEERDALVLALDEVDHLFQYPDTAREVLALLRVWHEMGKTDPLWQKLRIIVVHSTEIYIPMNINRSPFNVGLPVALNEFDASQLQNLASRHGISLEQEELANLMRMVGGHPYLVRLVFYHMQQGMHLKQILATATAEEGLFGDHLKRLLWHLKQEPALEEAARDVMCAQEPVRRSTELAFKLASLGLVKLHANHVQPTCDLYRVYFANRSK